MPPVSPAPVRIRTFVWQCVSAGTVAALAMMPFGLALRVLGLRVGYYGPKFASLFVDDPGRPVLLAQHVVLGWISAAPLVWILRRSSGDRVNPVAIGAAYGAAYYAAVNSLALPALFGDPTPWELGLDFVYPSLAIHLVFGVTVALVARPPCAASR